MRLSRALLTGSFVVERMASLRVIKIQYDPESVTAHRDIGLQIGAQVQDLLHQWKNQDTELTLMKDWMSAKYENRKIFDNFVRDTRAAFPQYFEELAGMADASGISLDDLTLSNLRGEILQFADPLMGQITTSDPATPTYDEEVYQRRPDKSVERPAYGKSSMEVESEQAALLKREKEEFMAAQRERPQETTEVAATKHAHKSCTDVYVNNGEYMGYGHNDDWGLDWRHLTYAAEAYDTKGNFLWFSFFYPGFLPGMDLVLNKYGITMTVNSLSPKKFGRSGVGLGWIGRRILEAKSIDEAVELVTDKRQSTAYSWNIGSINEKRMVNVENTQFGVGNTREVPVNSTYYHANDFNHLDINFVADDSTAHRHVVYERIIKEKPNHDGIKAVLGDSSDKKFPVFRENKSKDDPVWTEVSVIYDIGKGHMEIYPDISRDPPIKKYDYHEIMRLGSKYYDLYSAHSMVGLPAAVPGLVNGPDAKMTDKDEAKAEESKEYDYVEA